MLARILTLSDKVYWIKISIEIETKKGENQCIEILLNITNSTRGWPCANVYLCCWLQFLTTCIRHSSHVLPPRWPDFCLHFFDQISVFISSTRFLSSFLRPDFYLHPLLYLCSTDFSWNVDSEYEQSSFDDESNLVSQ